MQDASTHYLIVVLHRLRGNYKELESIKELTGQLFNQPTVITPQVSIGYLTSGNIAPIINKLLMKIDAAYNKAVIQYGEPDVKLILLGHSLGGLLARKLYVCACGSNAGAPLDSGITADKLARPWASKVERIILLAGMNNGWAIDYHTKFMTALRMSFGVAFGNFLSYFHRKPLLLTMRRGGSFITQLRLQTLEMLAAVPAKGIGNALTVQLLGSKDDLVSPKDDIDEIGGKTFIYKEVPYTGHRNIIDLKDSKIIVVKGQSTTAGAARTAVLTEVFTESASQLKNDAYAVPAFKNIVPDFSVKQLVFVVHGIRDEGFWTQKLANRILEAAGPERSSYATETASYGYFPLLQFALPGYRNAKVAWFMERYAENKIRFPNAAFSFIGHSNGTFLVAKALREYEACRFRHVLFAGSVVNRDYDWRKYINSGRVEKVYNIAASCDWVVGIFPQSLHALFGDLGAAGYFGFTGLNKSEQTITIPGNHGAAIDEQYWDQIAGFIVDGNFNPPIPIDPNPRKFTFYPWVAAIIFLLLFIAFVLFIPWWLASCINNGELKIISLVIYIFILWKFLTRY